MLQTATVGPAPVDLAARFALDGSRITIENLGGGPIRFSPAEAAGEAAPADLRAGFLLEPGERETLAPAGAGFPLWVWGIGEVGVGPAIGPAAVAGVGGAGGLSVILADAGVTGIRLGGVPAIGDTVLTLTATADQMAGIRVGHRALVGPELHRIEAVDAANLQITIAAPGLVRDASVLLNARVSTAPLYGEDDVLQLPGGGYRHLEVRFLGEARRANGADGTRNECSGSYWSPGASWTRSNLVGSATWKAGGNVEEGLDSYTVGVVHVSQADTNTWTLEFDPATNRLSFLAVLATGSSGYIPRIYRMVVAGG